MSQTWRAPGRINLIGEHTDYNLGYVCPMAIDRDCHVTAEPNAERVVRVLSHQFPDGRECPVDELEQAEPTQHWTDYCFGVARELRRAGFDLPPVTLTVDSHVPVGAGLSSSASLEVATALALLGGREMNPLELAQLCQRAESDFVGMPCGIMDQYISVFGEILMIDCRDLSARDIALPDGVAVIAVNSGVKHQLAAGSAYADRVQECLRVAQQIGVESLRDAKPEQVQFSQHARHVVSENQRVVDFVAAAQRGDVGAMGELFTASHRSLQHDYEVSCEELDVSVEAVEGAGALGARMTGGGFGGSSIALLPEGSVDAAVGAVTAAFAARGWREPQCFVVTAGAAAARDADRKSVV